MSQGAVRGSGLSRWATILMFLLGLFTFLFVNGIAGLGIIALAVGMYLFNRRLRRRAERSVEEKIGPTLS